MARTETELDSMRVAHLQAALIDRISQLKMNLNPVRERLTAIQQAQSPEFWQTATVPALEGIRTELRGIMQYRQWTPGTGEPRITDIAERLFLEFVNGVWWTVSVGTSLWKIPLWRYLPGDTGVVGINDTSTKASGVYYGRLAEMTPGERLGVGLALWAAGDSMQRAGIRRQYPGADEDEITYRLGVARFGEDLARRVYRR